ncbi:hypothetical protein A4H96_07300 [Acidithiobacillus ferrooxidans]|uniref:Uncharacterized protein n=1 Tax=Acidithiobacillus ferrooxidans TaxID=920 RepID=A0A179BJC3_ACIFR|nr:hypothetical protein A4H96_07300 [Acidithiobacillus ferrooxidans]
MNGFYWSNDVIFFPLLNDRNQSLSAIENGRPRIPHHLCFIHTRISAPSINLLETTQLPLYV